VLYHSNGDGTFTDVTRKVVYPAGRRWASSADIDDDGDQDSS
jgi:hypothetical protein